MFHKNPVFTPIEPRGAFFPHARLAEAWTPYQCMGTISNPAKGLFEGTVFPELVRHYIPHPYSRKRY